MDNRVAVVIPIYKEKTSYTEKVAIEQLKKHLLRFDIICIGPEGIVAEGLEWCSYEFFNTDFFRDTNSYSSLLLSYDFYNRFNKYEYILIYQLDALVFNDQLITFVNQGYDYYGAPVAAYDWPWIDRIVTPVHGRLVGNGGLSLRNIEKCKMAVKYHEDFVKWYPLKHYVGVEDLFFSSCCKYKDLCFKVADYSIARRFAIQNISDIHELDDELFGCHAWSKKELYSIWRGKLEELGYDLGRMDKEVGYNEGYDYIQVDKYFNKTEIYDISRKNACRIKKLLSEMLGTERVYVYGGGVIGYRCVDTFTNAGMTVVTIFDRDYLNLSNYYNYPCESPKKISEKEEGIPIIVANVRDFRSISNELRGLGYCDRIDFYFYLDIEEQILNISI